MLSRLKFDIDSLVNEILDQLPEEVFKSDKTTFCDPAMGGGQFVKEVEARLRRHGHDNVNISKRVYGYEANPMRINYAVDRWGLVGTYEAKNFLDEDINMKFDAIVGNPPYSTGKSNGNLYDKFTLLALNKANIVAFVTPSRFIISRKLEMIKMRNCIESKGLIKYKKLSSDTFSEIIAGGAVYWIAGAGKETFNSPEIQLAKKISSYTLSNQFNMSRGQVKIFEKDKQYYSTTKKKNTIEHIIRLKNNVPKIVYINKNKYRQFIKLHKNMFLFNQRSGISLNFVKYNKEFICTPNICCIILNDKDNIINLKKYTESKIWKFLTLTTGQIMNNGKTAVMNPKWFRDTFPLINLTKSWTDKELYKHFKLTKEEIDLIENTVK